MLLELAREEGPSFYNEVDVTSKEISLASSPYGSRGGGARVGSGHLSGLGPRMGTLEEWVSFPPQQWGWDSQFQVRVLRVRCWKGALSGVGVQGWLGPGKLVQAGDGQRGHLAKR